MKRTIVLLILLCGTIVLPLVAQDKFSFVYRASILAIMEDNGLEGDSSPVLFSPGFSVAMPLNKFIQFEPGVDLYFTYYAYSSLLGRAVPISVEHRSASVYGMMLNIPLDFSFRIANIVGFHSSVGLAADLRLCMLADGLDSDLQGRAEAEKETEQISSYFWGGGRWIYPTASFGFNFPVTKKYFLGAELRVWYPLYHLWTGESLPFVENLRIALGLRLTSTP